MEFDTYTAVLLVLRPDRPSLTEAEETELQNAHLAYLAELHEDGHLLAAGPLTDPEDDFRGLALLNVDPERARELQEADPAVRAGKYSLRVMRWRVPGGATHFTPTRFPKSIADAMS